MESRIRPLIYISILLILLLISVGFINYYYVKKIDNSYTELVNTMMKEDNTIHEVTRNSSKTLLLLSKLLRATDGKEKQNLINDLNLFREKNNVNFKILDSICNGDFKKKNLQKLELVRRDFLVSKDSLLNLIEIYGPQEFVKTYYRNVVKNKLDEYQDQQMLFAYNAKFVMAKNSDGITVLSDRIRNITFGLMFTPLLLILIGIVYVLIILYQTSNYEQDDI